jgi:hypothetical protein
LQEPNLSKTNHRVSLYIHSRFVLRPLSDSFIFLTLTRLVVVLKFINFRFALFTPPLGDFHGQPGVPLWRGQRVPRRGRRGQRGTQPAQPAARSRRGSRPARAVDSQRGLPAWWPDAPSHSPAAASLVGSALVRSVAELPSCAARPTCPRLAQERTRHGSQRPRAASAARAAPAQLLAPLRVAQDWFVGEMVVAT